MRIAVSAMEGSLDARIDPRFGRCPYFVLVDSESMEYEAFDNTNNALGGGAGIQSAQFVASKGADVVITGNCGPNAVRTLDAAGVEVVTGQTGTVREAVEAFRKGGLSTTKEPNVGDHHGLASAGPPAGFPARAGGTGGGFGCGRGMGKAPGGSFSQGQLQELRDQNEQMRKQIEALSARIHQLEQRLI